MPISLKKRYAITFIISVNDEEVFKGNALASPVFKTGHRHEIIAKRRFSSAALAYNQAIEEARNPVLVFMHQDVYLPEGWDKRFVEEIAFLEKQGRCGVVGCYGVALDGNPAGHVYSNGLQRELGGIRAADQVQSLDELLLAFRKDTGLRFDPLMPHFHLFGTDICLESKRRGLKNYAISNICLHNSLRVKSLPVEYWRCAEYIRLKWQSELPVKSCCATIYPKKSRMLCLRAIARLKACRTPKQCMSGSERLTIPCQNEILE